ncbi:MAG: M3 family metallopeptidase [Pseudobdellovibrionaceae bacterium]
MAPQSSQNPFIEAFDKKTFQTRDEAIPFDRLTLDSYLPALENGIERARVNIKKIKDSAEKPNFENVILALETASEDYEIVQSVYFNLFSAEASEDMQALAKEISPKSAAFASEIALDEKLFEKIKNVYENREALKMNPEQIRLTEKYFKDFSRNGALLSPADKERLKKIDQELSILGPQFSENVLKATNAFELVIDNKSDLLGLPEGVIEAAAQEAEGKGQPGKWLFNLQAPSFLPFMQYANNRELRKKLWLAYNSRSFKDSFDNQEIVKKIVRLRHERSQLLGFKTHADFILSERMAQTPDQVMKFLNELLSPSKKAADRDLAELRAFKKSVAGNDEVLPWDFAYYSEKLKEKKYKFNDEELRPYFKLETVVEGVFEHARRLYGITFKEVLDVPKYHPDVRAFEVREERTQNYVGLFYTDFFPRETKKGGAWMTVYREQGFNKGQVRRPHVSIVCNFTKPTSSKPSLLTYDEVQTLFHEFGHALHGLLSQVSYRSLAGTNVYWDFVELPSQIMENWVKEKEGLDIFARHYQTNQPIPVELVEKIKKASQFQAGYYSMRQLQFGFLDMAWHSQDPASIQDVDAFENKVTEGTRILAKVPGTNVSCAFSHIFAGGYSAGYYSYKWAEVLDADAFEYFKEMGLFNRDIADKFKSHVLSRGGTEHPMELYKKFRGREPDPKALLRREGLLSV